MPFVGNIIPPSLAGADPPARQADRVRERRRTAAPKAAALPEDEAELASASGVDGVSVIRSTKGNADEEAHDDRTSQGYYDPRGATRGSPSVRHRLDVAG